MEITSYLILNYIDSLKQYYFVGGMPEAVQSFAENKDFNEVREIQKRILAAYEQDFSKHAPNEIVPRLRMLWNSIPSQLAKENKKFIYGLVREGARAKDYETAIMWLSDCGLVHKVSRVNATGIPLRAYEDLKAFKLFLVDVGLLGCMTGLHQRTLLDGNDLFVEFKGALTEQYVCQQLKNIEDLGIYYYTNDRGSCEVDFVIDTELSTILQATDYASAEARVIITVHPVNDQLLSVIGKLTAEYGRIGNNLNQIARSLNEWHSPYPEMAKELRDSAADLAALKYEVLQKVGDALGNIQTYQL